MKLLGTFAIVTCLVPSFLSIRLDYGVDGRSDLVSQPSGNEAIETVMEALSQNFTTASNHAISQLTSVLMLKNSSSVVDGLRANIDAFRSGLLNRLQADLSESAKQFNSQRGSGPVTDEQKYQFSEMVQEKWEETLSSELATFQQSVLPRWVNSVRNVWKGTERSVMENIQKFKKFIFKHLPATSSTCQIPKSGLMKGVNSMDIVGNGRHGISKRFHHVVGVALLAVMVAGSVALAIFAPFMLIAIGFVTLFDVAICLAIHRMDEDVVDSYDDDKEGLNTRIR